MLNGKKRILAPAFVVAFLLAVPLAFLVEGCLGGGGTEGEGGVTYDKISPGLRIEVIDSLSGEPLSVDTVFASLLPTAPEDPEEDSTALEGIRGSGNAWSVFPGSTKRTVYIRVRETETTADTLCGYLGSKTVAVYVDKLPKTVTVRLALRLVCQ